MGNFNRDDRGGGGRDFSPRGRSSFGRGGFSGGRGFGGGRSDRPMFKAICSNCGKECEVPFRPTGAKPVFCSECFEKRSRDAGHDNFQDRGPRPSSFENRDGGQAQSRELSAINVKLDKILAMLAPSAPVKTTQEEKTEEKIVEKAKGPESFDSAQDQRPVEGVEKKKVAKKKKV